MKKSNHLRQHLDTFIAAYNYGRRLKCLKGLAPYEFICKCWTNQPDRFRIDPIYQMPGLNTLDIFGVGFDADADGRLMFFESNATMNVLSNAPAPTHSLPSVEREFLAAVDKLLMGHTVH